jgi:hypothetical protein
VVKHREPGDGDLLLLWRRMRKEQEKEKEMVSEEMDGRMLMEGRSGKVGPSVIVEATGSHFHQFPLTAEHESSTPSWL